jgi:hypothetical protein
MRTLLSLFPARHMLIVCGFLMVCGLVMSEVLMHLVVFFSPRFTSFCVSVIICWLVLDNLTLAFDLVALPHNTTQSECMMLRRLRAADQHINFIRAQFDDEKTSHIRTAAQLDVLEGRFRDGVYTAMHWSLLASKVIVLSRIEKMAMCGHVKRMDHRLMIRPKSTDDCSFYSTSR